MGIHVSTVHIYLTYSREKRVEMREERRKGEGGRRGEGEERGLRKSEQGERREEKGERILERRSKEKGGGKTVSERISLPL